MMLRMKLQFGRKNFKSRCSGRLMEKYDVLKLQGKSVDDKGRTTTRGKFENEVCERIQKEWKLERWYSGGEVGSNENSIVRDFNLCPGNSMQKAGGLV